MALSLRLFRITGHARDRWVERTRRTVDVCLAVIHSRVILKTSDDCRLLLRFAPETAVFLCQRDGPSERWNVVTVITVPNDEPLPETLLRLRSIKHWGRT